MCSLSTSFFLLLTHGHSLSPQRHRKLPFTSPITFLSHYSLKNNPTCSFSSPIAGHKSSSFSWISPDDPSIDDLGGWAFHESPMPQKKKGIKWLYRSSSPVPSVEVAFDIEDSEPTHSDPPGESNEVNKKTEVGSSDVVTKSRDSGQIKRLQPNRPATVAQAAVALTSGRMIEAIQGELSRIQIEQSSRKAAREEIKQELLDRGEIERCWVEMMEEVKRRGVKVQQLYVGALNLLEQEKIVQEGALNGFLKEKAALDCQRQLLESLKDEVNEMSERLVSEKTELVHEEEKSQTLHSDLQSKKEGILDAKSLLESEIEALRILRSWIEDEARKSKARSKFLEEAGRRWKWYSQ
ncbi:Lamin-L(III) [Bienertia sinuspersici]